MIQHGIGHILRDDHFGIIKAQVVIHRAINDVLIFQRGGISCIEKGNVIYFRGMATGTVHIDITAGPVFKGSREVVLGRDGHVVAHIGIGNGLGDNTHLT